MSRHAFPFTQKQRGRATLAPYSKATGVRVRTALLLCTVTNVGATRCPRKPSVTFFRGAFALNQQTLLLTRPAPKRMPGFALFLVPLAFGLTSQNFLFIAANSHNRIAPRSTSLALQYWCKWQGV